MTLQEILKAKGLSDEDVEAIIGEMKQNKIFTASEENLDIRYGKLKQDHDNLAAQHGESTKLIEQLQKDNKGNEALQKSVQDYQTQMEAMQAQMAQDKLGYALRLALMTDKALDPDYLVYKAMEKHPEWKDNPEAALDENGKVKGVDDLVAGLKTQFPAQFETAETKRTVEPQKLPPSDNNRGGYTRSEILKKPYAERQRLYADNPEAYKEAMKG